ncbi:hypothetical protein EI42_03090 [Thermosporothrix hazakensis]|uniref:Uncharacterized protein n=1 Tax=Thermosporothrix hazakensis TaxID=644383 RepID=A0A326U8X9_THEHA|nr:hypothetical protein EI42_03090 [Thermosporothrix hazakensis]GCE46304.1 hypothetical protein KTH_11730 [Thermosporothrix hazakensis]
MEKDAKLVRNETVAQRRGIFKWLATIAAGASVATIGLGLNTGGTAKAAAEDKPMSFLKKQKTVGTVTTFNDPSIKCIPCPEEGSCSFLGCVTNTVDCGISTPYKSIIRIYHGGCYGNAKDCPFTDYTYCGDRCVSC